MHRSSFRPQRRLAGDLHKPKVAPPAPDRDLDGIREQIENVTKTLSPLRASVERLAAPKQDISVPSDIAQALRLAHGRLDRVEKQQEAMLSELRRMASAFSNAILKLSDKVEKISGGEDSSFSLAHSLEKLLAVLTSRKLRIIRDSNGDMVEVETVSPPQN